MSFPSPSVIISGSPPRVWGILFIDPCLAISSRFTPTRVGNTAIVFAITPPYPVHPHACGEYCVGSICCVGRLGSPPRVWGIPSNFCPGSCARKVHPHACGEYLRRVATDPACLTVHPHACGEYGVECRHLRLGVGSPPRVWGILNDDIVVNGSTRFTPTRVGNTEAGDLGAKFVAVHPHACGEYPEQRFGQTRLVGSPPRVWGILLTLCKPRRQSTVHPHACGEYTISAHFGAKRLQSPVYGGTKSA